ncbi:DHH family phosphoesterase [Bacillus xiapuensis]|uniref:DHH family phosphoesterase n=1 Tax=Bacillus xiapuensis TaxID=2014075 RepID=A0ABU6N853_9BACI|nr:DHH family phosphoesterase [Bacillus xiapuensis]
MFKYRLIGENDYVFDVQGTILKNRGIKDVNQFLTIDKKVENSYKKLKNIQKAVDCLNKHIEKNSNILIVIDPDVDGYTSGCIMYQYLKMLDENMKVKWVVHDDKVHGLKGIEIPKGINLIIIPDAGSNDFGEHYELNFQGIDIIVLDHHECERESEHAIVVNPQLGGYPNLNLSGAGITYKFCQALDDYYWNDFADYFLDLVALGNIADSMSMTELETRYYVEKGLQDINNDFFQALISQQEYSMKGKLNITTVSFYIAPLINSVIRVGSLNDKLDMFKSFIGVKELVKYKPRGSDETLVPLVNDMARRCTNIKAKQKRMTDKITLEVESKIQSENLNWNKVILIHGLESIDQGLTGLVCNQIAARHKKPTIVLSKKNRKGNYKGSARGYDKGELKDFKAITESTGLFEMAKGHLNAYGLEIKEENIQAAIEKFNLLLSDYNFEPVYEVDFMVPAESMNDYIVKEIVKLSDLWGKDVEEPFILVEKIPISESDVSLMGQKQDTISILHNSIKYMFFRQSEDVYNQINEGNYITIVGKGSVNEYKGQKTYQLIVDNFHVFS